MVINPLVGVYIPIIRIPIKGEMTIPNIATFDHGTYDLSEMILFFCGKKLGSHILKNVPCLFLGSTICFGLF